MEFLHRGMFCLLLDLVGGICVSVYPSTDVWFSVSRSFTVGNGVRADILRGRRGRAGGPAGRGPRRASARAGAREQAAPGSARLPQAAGREGGRGRGDQAAGTPVRRGGPRRADWRAGARELPQRGDRKSVV